MRRSSVHSQPIRTTATERTTSPPGIGHATCDSVSRFDEASTEHVAYTLVEAFVLVALVVFAFLGDRRRH